jgi:protein-S-isoprenylcysteine O-methyltransferase Ste14
MCDVIATLSLADPSISTPNLVQRAFCPSIHSSRAIMWTIQPTMIAGTIMVATAAALRLWCFRTLGQLFTFEVTIRPKHELITDGPYAYVRHPSYTGVFLTLLGATAVLCSPGTWLMECGILSRGGVVMLGFWIIKCAIAFKGTILRLRTEDEALRKTFGSRWDDYARRVPYSLIPGMI